MHKKRAGRKDWKHYTVKSLAFWVITAIVTGIIFGMVDPQLAIKSKPGIDYFILVLKFLVGPFDKNSLNVY